MVLTLQWRLRDVDLDIKLTGDYEPKNFIPKKLVHTYKYHTKSITQIRFLPDTGHLLLSASADSKMALWDVYHQRELLRTFSGHTKSVNDIDFHPSGTQFLSASYDRFMKLWDTETGKCLNKFTTGKTPHVVRINPSKPHEFLAGMSDKKIIQYDTRSGEMVQEYDHHLGPVNTITFCDEVSSALPCPRHTINRPRIAASSQPRTTSPFAHGNTASPSLSSSSLNRTCSQWCGPRRTRQANTLPSSRRTIKSPFIPPPIGFGRIARKAIGDTTWLDMLPMLPSVRMDSLLARVTAAVTYASGTGRRARCGIRSRQAMRRCWRCNGILESRPRSSPAISMGL